MAIKYKDVKTGAVVRLGRFLAEENKSISNATATVVSKAGDSSGHHISVRVADKLYTVHLPNIKEIIS